MFGELAYAITSGGTFTFVALSVLALATEGGSDRAIGVLLVEDSGAACRSIRTLNCRPNIPSSAYSEKRTSKFKIPEITELSMQNTEYTQ